ncbi:MAG: zinc ribbon domain-containing protein [Lachnospiraceae bacterium]|nr:zinc ribbon domain-containing protein [Lachnospiraceae bacterium]
MKICPFCGNQVEEFDFMCPKCGNELTTGLGMEEKSTNNIDNGENSASNNNSQGYSAYGGDTSGQVYSSYGGNTTNQGYTPYGGDSTNQGYTPYGGDSTNQGYTPYGGDSTNQGYTPYGGDTTNQSYSSYNSSSNSNYSSYSLNAANDTNSGYSSYNAGNTGGNGTYPSYNQMNGMNNNMNSNFETSSYSKNKKTNSGLIVAILIVVALFAAANFFLMSGLKYKKYNKVTERAMKARYTYDRKEIGRVYAYNMMGLIDEADNKQGYGGMMSGEYLENMVKGILKSKYGSDYKFSYKIKSVDSVKKSKIKDIISSEEDDIFDLIVSKYSSKTINDVINADDIKEMKKIVADIKVKGSKENGYGQMKMYIVKMKGKSEWKVLYIHANDTDW